MEKKVKFTTNLDKELLKKIKIKAIEEGRNVNEILEELIKNYEGKNLTDLNNIVDLGERGNNHE